MNKGYERLKRIVYVAPKSGDKITLDVGEFGKIYYNKILLKEHIINPQQGYKYVIPPAEANFRGLLPVHRIVALAWVPGMTRRKKMVNHIDSDRLNNMASNLEWTTRKQNNRTEHARKMKSKNASCTNHDNEVIKATKGDEVRYFKNGHIAAKGIGCSFPLIYLVLNPNHYAKTAKGWNLEWVPVEQMIGDFTQAE